MNDSDALYGEVILDHGKRPRQTAHPAQPTHTARCDNPLCGDRVELALRLEGDRIAEIGCLTRGCMLAVAAGSVMAEALRGCTGEQARELMAGFRRVVAGEDAPASEGAMAPEALRAFRPLAHHPMRQACATLPWDALAAALRGH